MHSHILDAVASLSSLTYQHYALLTLLTPFLLCIYRLTLHPLSKFPGPKSAACTSLYYAYWIRRGRLPQHLEVLFKKYNTDVLRIAPGQLVFRTAQSMKDIGTSKEAYRGRFNFQLVGFTQNSLTTAKDLDVHRRKRKILSLGFAAGTLAQQEPTLIIPVVEKLINRVSDLEGAVFDIGAYFDCVTTDVIGRLAFGADFHMLDKLDAHPFLHVIAHALKMSIIAQAIPPVYNFLGKLYNHGPSFLTPKSLRGVTDFAEMQMKARADRDANGEVDGDQRDIMSIITNGTANEKDASMRMDQRELLGEATTLVAAGGDSAASALTVTMFPLMSHKDILQELQEGIRAAFPDYDTITSKTIMHDIPLVDAVINESMRLTPVTPGPFWRHIDHPISVDGHMIPANTEVGAARYSIWHDEKTFHDAHKFVPHRSLDHKNTEHLDAFQPWGIGSRTCIGRQLAMIEMRLILAKLLWKFDWELLTTTYDNPDYAVLFKAPLLVRATARKDNA